MSELTIDIQVKATQALKQMAATELENSVRTQKLAKRLKLLGVKSNVDEISMQLTELAKSAWGRGIATFVGGTSDPLDQYVWALPKQE